MPQNNEARVVVVTNISDFDFTHPYGGIPYNLPVGKPMLFPYAIADHLATHLARQIILRKAPVRDENAVDGRGGESVRSDRPLWTDETINELKKKIMKDAYEQAPTPQLSDAEIMKQRIDELNREFPVTAGAAPSAQAPEVLISTDDGIKAVMPTGEVITYADKGEVMAALKAKGIVFDARKSRADLEKLLK